MQSIDRQFDDNGDPIQSNTFALTDGDMAEWAKMQRFTAAPTPEAQSAPWWQNLVSYGVTKAIDNSFPSESRGVQGNTRPGSFAGQNGRSYDQRGSQNAPPISSVGGLVSSVASMSPLMLAGIAAALFFAFKK